MPTRTRLLSLFAVTVLAAACAGGGSPAPSPTPRPSPTPIDVPVTSPGDAAALVIATDPQFKGAVELRPDLIGLSKWWEAEALADGAYRIKVTIGWGDCPSGCISRHVWIFHVDAHGAVALESQSGDAVPASLPA